MLAVWQQTIVDEEGNTVAGASVRVMNADTDALVTIKPARDGSGTLANPFTADSDGFARFYVADGRYKIRVTYAGNTRTHEHVVLLSDANRDPNAPGYLSDTPAAGVTHDYSPSLWSSVAASARIILELEPGAGASSLGGLDPTGVQDGAEVILTCKDANGLTLLTEDTSATAAWRFQSAYDLTLTNNGACRLIRSSILSRWIVLP